MTHRLILTVLVLAALIGASSCKQDQENKKKESEQTVADPIVARLDELNKSIRNDSLNPDLYHERALFYLENEEFNEAFKDITSALEIDSTSSGYYVTLSDIYLSMGKLQKSIESLERSIELKKENPEAYLRMAEINIVILDYPEALAYIDRALQADELASRGYLLRGVVMLETGDTIRAIRNFQKAIDVNQDYFDAHMQLAQLYAMKGNDLAVDYFNNALNIQPDNYEVMYYLAMYFQETGKYDKAIRQYNLLLERNPDFYFALYNIGYINLVYLEDYQAAIDYFTRTIELREDYTEAYYNRGFAYELMKDVDHSWADYKKTLELHPNYEKAIEGLNRIEAFRKNSNE
ncbi:MAG: tetratricopeptide repeat protein [Bacteroidetes bacterium]|nr:tetratricopeptide repeat protein [Bacteroidota bacterium]